MQIDENTKIIGRFHTKPSPRGLNIYNPFFEEAGINAVYLLFYNPDPKILMDGLRSLNISGAITAGFETNPNFSKLIDELDESSIDIGRVGFVVNKDGIVKGYYQGGEGLLRSIKQSTPIGRKEIVIVGSGNVAKSLLFNLSEEGNLPQVTICNRTVKNAEQIAKNFDFVKGVFPLENLSKLSGQVLINATDIGGSVIDKIYNEKIVRNFAAVSDVTFEREDTNLIRIAKKLGKKYSTGWDMFTYQGQVALETILRTKISAELLKKHVTKGLTQVVG